jgi:hypothetical protein
MLVSLINGHGTADPCFPADGTVDRFVVARMEKLRGQGFNFRDIAAVLTRQGLTLSAERIKEILDAHQVRQRTK